MIFTSSLCKLSIFQILIKILLRHLDRSTPNTIQWRPQIWRGSALASLHCFLQDYFGAIDGSRSWLPIRFPKELWELCQSQRKLESYSGFRRQMSGMDCLDSLHLAVGLLFDQLVYLVCHPHRHFASFTNQSFSWDPRYYLLWRWVWAYLKKFHSCKQGKPMLPLAVLAIRICISNNKDGRRESQRAPLLFQGRCCTRTCWSVLSSFD